MLGPSLTGYYLTSLLLPVLSLDHDSASSWRSSAPGWHREQFQAVTPAIAESRHVGVFAGARVLYGLSSRVIGADLGSEAALRRVYLWRGGKLSAMRGQDRLGG